MNKKKWALLVCCLLLLAGYYKLFYKTYSEKAVAKSADCIIALDVKRIINTVIWNVITTPSQWKKGSIFPSDEGGVDWDDMVKIPDYVFVFHSAHQPVNAWYTVLQINKKEDFQKGLQQYGFEKKEDLLFSKRLGVLLLQMGDTLLVSNLAPEDQQYLRQTAGELFVKKQHCTRATVKTNVEASSHLSIQLLKNKFIKDAAVIKANFDKNSIRADASFIASEAFDFSESSFSYAANSLVALGFTQPSPAVYNLISDSSRATISKALNFDIDSLFLPGNHQYTVDITSIQSRTDSAISYVYDDNFTPVEKVVVNQVMEPSFNFSIAGQGSPRVYGYWRNNGKLESTVEGDLFIPMPFVKSYCSKKSDQELSITSRNYTAPAADKKLHCFFFINIVLSKIPIPVIKFLPDAVMKMITNMESLNVIAQKNKERIEVHAVLTKKENDLPLIEW
jgi:hypothetical protein